MAETTTKDEHHLLAVYLRDHFAGAAAGLALAERCRRSNEDNPLGPVLGEIVAEISADRDSLREIIRALDVSEDPIKAVLGQAGELRRPPEDQRRVDPLLAVQVGSSSSKGCWPDRCQAQPLAVASRGRCRAVGAQRSRPRGADRAGHLPTRAPPGRARASGPDRLRRRRLTPGGLPSRPTLSPGSRRVRDSTGRDRSEEPAMGIYRDKVLPRIVDKACGIKAAEPLRAGSARASMARSWSSASAVGHNASHYPASVTSVSAIEPSDLAWKLAADRVPPRPSPSPGPDSTGSGCRCPTTAATRRCRRGRSARSPTSLPRSPRSAGAQAWRHLPLRRARPRSG